MDRIQDAKAVPVRPKAKAKGEGFDELEERLDEKQINIIETVQKKVQVNTDTRSASKPNTSTS